MNNDSHTTQLIIVCESLSSCNLKCEIGHIIPVSSAGNQTLLRTGLCRTQVPFLPLGVNFERPFFSSVTFHYTKKPQNIGMFGAVP